MTTTQKNSFIQFYTPSRYYDYIDLGNGFSDTWDFCTQKGNIFWLEHRGLEWASTYKILNNKSELYKFEEVKLPEKTNKIYISTLYTTHLYQSYVWAKQYPEITFIVGGPAVISNLFTLLEPLPYNLILTTKSVEEYFGENDFSFKWKLENIPTKQKIVFSYTVDTSCYWGKCIYCNFTFCKRRIRKDLNFEFNNLDWNGEKIIRINTSSTTPKQIKSIFSLIPRIENTRYDFYLRFGNNEYEALKKIKNKISDLKIRILTGIEFPSDKMLFFMNKGITTEEIFNMLRFLEEMPNIEATLFIILGWEELERNDLLNLKEFLKKVPQNCTIALTRIFARPFTKLHNMYTKEKEQKIGPFYFGFIPKISDEKMKLNIEARDIILSNKNVLDFSRGIL